LGKEGVEKLRPLAPRRKVGGLSGLRDASQPEVKRLGYQLATGVGVEVEAPLCNAHQLGHVFHGEALATLFG